MVAPAIAAGLFFSASVWCAAPAAAQAIPNIEQRISGAFSLIIANSQDLAVPLARRALAERSIAAASLTGASAPAGASLIETYGFPAGGPPTAAAPPSEADAAAAVPASVAALEQGSAEDIARLPRPRPGARDEESAAPTQLTSLPLDLVAGAALDLPLPESAAPPALALAAPPSVPSGSALGAAVQEGAPIAAAPPPLLAAAPAADIAAPPPGQAAVPPADLFAGQACTSIADLKDDDGDFRRNAEVLSGSGFCIVQTQFQERRQRWTIHTISTGRPGPLWTVMHDDEDISFDTAVYALARHGGTLVSVETGGKRNLAGIDPNRNFSGGGIGCSKLGNDAAPQFTAYFRDLLDPLLPVVALHNNTGEAIPTGGVGHVTMANVPRSMEEARSRNPGSPFAGEHTLILLAALQSDTTAASSRAAELSAAGVNAVVERVPDGRGDCSLSNYALLGGHEDFFNVTVGADQADRQRGMVDVIMAGMQTVAAR